jgi:D-alanyl-D-alanine carboxypeptidase
MGSPDFAGGTDAGSTDAGAADLAMPRSAACLAQDAKLQAMLDNVRVTKTPCPELGLAVSTPACGLTSYVSSSDASAPTNHTYRVASNTKTFTASVILKLVADGKLGLDDLVSSILPTAPGVTGMTVRQILSHTSGLFDYASDDNFNAERAANPMRQWSPDELLQVAASHPPDFAPGTSWSYSNTGFIVAGMIAVKLGGAEISQQIRDRLLTPAGLPAIYFDSEEPPQGTLAKAYDDSGNDVSMKYNESWIWSAGAIVATTADLTNWMIQLGSGKVHDPMWQSELTNGVQTGRAGETYGLGLFMFDASYNGGAGRSVGHIGFLAGYQSQSFYFPDTDVAITGITTCNGGDPNDIRIGAIGVLFP